MQAPLLATMLAAAHDRAAALAPRRAELARRAAAAAPARSLVAALAGPAVGVIAEVKRRSPSAGTIRAALDPVAHGRAFARGGACAISVLTDAPFFGGSLGDLEDVARAVPCPVLRKDFIVDVLQVVEARGAGASAVLLIARALDAGRLAALTRAATDVGLEAVVEAHTARELEWALGSGAAIIGVNSRDLDSFAVNLSAAERLVRAVPPGVLVVAESGIRGRRDVERFARAGADAVLVGASVAGAADPEAAVRQLTGVPRGGRAVPVGSDDA